MNTTEQHVLASPPLLQQDHTFRVLQALKDHAVVVIDTQGKILSWNAGAEKLFGCSAQESRGQHFSLFSSGEDIELGHPTHVLEIAHTTGSYEEEGWRERKDGSRFWASIVINKLPDDGGHPGYVMVVRDRTERKEAEEKLKRSEERSRKLFDGIRDYAMITLNPDGTVATWNEGARRIEGYEAYQVLGKYFSIFYTEQDIQMGKCEYELKEAAETGRFEEEGWRIRKDGTKFWASVLITAIRNEEGNLLGFSKVTRDMTERKRADDLLKMAYANLEKRVEERTEEISQTNIKLQGAIRVRDEFLSIASHELRTPLTPLKLQLQRIILNARKGSLSQMAPEKLLHIADDCDKAISRLTGLIDNLLDVSRINSGKLVLDPGPVELGELAQTIIDRFSSQIEASESTVTLKVPRPVTGHFDRLRMEQVFVNLLSNALKFGQGKPVEISVEQERTMACFVFRDSGVGIQLKDQNRIFERFERVVSANNVDGLGLGLFITKQIVEAHGGSIKLHSTPGIGSIFLVKVPLQATLSV